MSKPSDALAIYDNILTIPTSIGEVPVYKLMEKFFYIEDKDGHRVLFQMNEPQVEMYKSMCVQRLMGKPIRQDYLKARQLGASTFIDLVGFAWCIFVPGRKAAIVADIAEHASNLFEKFNYVYDNLPEELKPKRIKSNAKELVVQYANGQKSSVRIMVQGESAGRSGTYQFLHLSECAFWDNLHDTLVSLLQTVSNENLDSMVFLETTANGVNEYKRRWDRDFAGESSYAAMFFGWYVGGDYKVKENQLRLFDKPQWLVELQEKLGLSDYQAQWYYEKYEEFDGDLDKLRQEFPSNPVEAFITTGNSVFNAELLQKRKLEIIEQILNTKSYTQGMFSYEAKFSEDGEVISVGKIQWVDSNVGHIKIYKKPERGHPYVVVNDPANGGEDYFATQIFDNYTGKQVAVYHRNKVDIDDCAFQMYCLLRYYNGCLSKDYPETIDDSLASGETNTTSYVLEMLHKMGYRNIYKDTDVQDLSNRYLNKYGFMTKTNNRQYMIDLFKVAFRKNPEIISDYETICEMENFENVKHANGKEKAEAANGSHDDLVMSCCGFFYCRERQRAYVNVVSQKSVSNPFDPLEESENSQERNVYQVWD